MQRVFDKFGLTENKIGKLPRSQRSLLLIMGMVVVIVFASLVSIAPQISNRFGKIAKDKQSQQSFAAGSLNSPCENYGDVDGDGDVDSIDALQITRHIAGFSTTVPFTGDVIKRADVDGNLEIESVDALVITKYVAFIYKTFPVCVDHDEDGFSDGVESYLGTDPYNPCGSSGWPADLFQGSIPNSTNKINILDLASYVVPTRYLNTNPGDDYIDEKGRHLKYDQRWDIVPGNGVFSKRINIEDIGYLVTFKAPMFGGNRAFNGATCVTKPKPSINFSVNPATINEGGQINLSWQATNAVFPCDATSTPFGLWEGHKNLSTNASPETIKLNNPGTYQFTITCYGPGGQSTPNTKTVTVKEVVTCGGNLSLSLNPSEIIQGGQVTISASGATNCTNGDEIDFKISVNGSWVNLGSCNLGSSGSCSRTFGANYPIGTYATIAFLDPGKNNQYAGSSNQIHLKINPVVVVPTGAKILPLGDSITVGIAGGYRTYLQGLIGNSYDVDFIGTQSGGAPDPEHEGHTGWSTGAFLNGSLSGWLGGYTPDIVLIHLGTNDIGSGCGGSIATAANNMVSIVNLLKGDNQNVKIIVAKINPFAGCSEKVKAYNDLLVSKLSGTANVYFADAFTGFNTSTDLGSDNIHPNSSGYQKIANAFWTPLSQLLGN